MKAISDLHEVVASRELIVVLAMREIRARYKYTLFGVAWAVALPVLLMLIFTFVFSRVAPVQTGGTPYPVFVYIGLLPWQLHANILTSASRSMVDNRSLVSKVYFTREALPLSRVLAALFDFFVAALVLVGLMLWYGIAPSAAALLLPMVFLVQLSLGVGLALLVSAANLLYRDVQYMLQVGLTAWMFASSVVYPLPSEGVFAVLNYLNPMTPILDSYRLLLLREFHGFPPQFWAAALISLATLVAGWRWFRKVERVFGELS